MLALWWIQTPWFNPFWSKSTFSGDLINYLETAKATLHLTPHLLNVTPVRSGQRRAALELLFLKKAICWVCQLHREIWETAELFHQKKWNMAGSGNYGIYSTRRVIWTQSSRAKVPFRPVRATNNKAEESPPPHESFQSIHADTLPPHTTTPRGDALVIKRKLN